MRTARATREGATLDRVTAAPGTRLERRAASGRGRGRGARAWERGRRSLAGVGHVGRELDGRAGLLRLEVRGFERRDGLPDVLAGVALGDEVGDAGAEEEGAREVDDGLEEDDEDAAGAGLADDARLLGLGRVGQRADGGGLA